jgi:membrane associated rhomboid family serine protease
VTPAPVRRPEETDWELELVRKLRYVYLPFLLVDVLFTAAYLLLAWALVLGTGLVSLDEQLLLYWLPAGLAWIPVLVWVGPRLKLLRLDMRDGRVRFVYLMAAWGATLATATMSADYLAKRTGQLTPLSDMLAISRSPITRYYTVERPCLHREARQFGWSLGVRTRPNDPQRYTLSIVVPFCGGDWSRGNGAPPAWLGLRFSRSIRPNAPDEQREFELREFARESELAFADMDLDRFTYLERPGPGDVRRAFEDPVRERYPDARDPLVLEPRVEPFESRADGLRENALAALGIGAGAWLFILIFPRLDLARFRAFRDGARGSSASPVSWRRAVAWSLGIRGTLALGGVSVGVYVVMVFSGLGVLGFHPEDLARWGAISRPLFEDGGEWRLVTSQFVHANLPHLGGNLYGLLLAGALLEGIVGMRRVAVAYLLTGIAGGLASLAVHPEAVAVGASGSIFGLFGVLFGLLLLKDERVAPLRKFLLTGGAVFVGVNLLLGAAVPEINNAGHLGGLVAGAVLSPLLRRSAPPRRVVEGPEGSDT